MLTVKYVNRQGHEEVISAENVRYIPDVGDAESFGSAGVYIDPEDHPSGTPSGAKMIIPASRTHSSEDRSIPTVYVMNRYGSTVATYRL